MDSFTIAVLVGAAVVILIFGAMTAFDKGKTPASPPTAPAKAAGKR